MNRISGLEKSQAPWHLRWFYTVLRKMFGTASTASSTWAVMNFISRR